MDNVPKRKKVPRKLLDKDIRKRSWNFSSCNGFSNVQFGSDNAFACKANVDNSSQLHKRMSLCNRGNVHLESSGITPGKSYFGSFHIHIDSIPDDFYLISNAKYSLKFDQSGPNRTLTLKISYLRNIQTFKCFASWLDRFGGVDTCSYDVDDLLIDLSLANNLVSCFISLEDPHNFLVDVALSKENYESVWIPRNDDPPKRKDLSVGYLTRYFHGVGNLPDNPISSQMKMDSPNSWFRLFFNAKAKLLTNFASTDNSSLSSLPSRLTTKLRRYQMSAVEWMIHRETKQLEINPVNSAMESIISMIPMKDGLPIFFNRISCRFHVEVPTFFEYPKGGILADEMGLGKTIEILSLIICNPDSREAKHLSSTDTEISECKSVTLNQDICNSKDIYFSCVCGDESKDFDLVICKECSSMQHDICVGWSQNLKGETYRCPYCILSRGLISSRATLVVSPMSICGQWADEIYRHVNKKSDIQLKVFTYPGVKLAGMYIQPQALSDNDVVIVSYETLRNELANANLQFTNRSSSLRVTKRFMAVPSPLPAIRWWRLCLDEAQMVESPNQAAEMVNRLESVNRWCVTGTPVSHTIDDLFGLFAFLRYPLFSTKLYWNKLISRPYFEGRDDPLIELLSTVFWRTARHDVLDQIGVPPISESIIYITFSPVEEHLYRHRYSLAKLKLAVSELSGYQTDISLRQIDRRLVDRFLDPMLPLRRACNDFGRKQYSAGTSHHRQPSSAIGLKIQTLMTMDQVLNDLVQKAVATCIDYNRKHIMCLNGLAGLYILKKDFSKATEFYRRILWTAEENSLICETDKLQLIHAMHNLYDVLEMARSQGSNHLERAIGDDDLPEREKAIVSTYVEKLSNRVSQSAELVEKENKAIRELDGNFYEEWWAEVCERLLNNLSDDDLVDFFIRLQNNLQETCNTGVNSLASHLTRPDAFMMAMLKRLDSLSSLRKCWIDAVLGKLTKISPSELSSKLSECACTKVVNSPTKKNFTETTGDCHFCLAMKKCIEYEKLLFNARKNRNSDKDDIWAWSDSEVERALKFLLGFAKRNLKRFKYTASSTDTEELFKSGEKHVERFHLLKGEFRHLRQLWMSLKDRVGAEIELTMASDRLMLLDENAFTNKNDRPSKAYVFPSEIPVMIEDNLRDAEMSKFDFEKACGQLRYLQNLEKTSTETSNQEKCPICMNLLDQAWVVLPCAHCVCLSCVTQLKSAGLRSRLVPCPVCRNTCQVHELACVSLRSVDELYSDSEVEVLGNYSTKIMAVVKLIKVVLLKDQDAKFLIFSSWLDVLTNLVHVLSENRISALVLQKGGSKFAKKHHKLGEPFRDKFTSTLRQFKVTGEGSITALLLPYSSGSNGLNLTEANHVIMMDPCLTNSTDAQAVARVYRIGQKRPTTVHRLLVRSSIEERIYSILVNKQRHHLHNELDGDDIETAAIEDALNNENDYLEDAVVGDLLNLYTSEIDQGDLGISKT